MQTQIFDHSSLKMTTKTCIAGLTAAALFAGTAQAASIEVLAADGLRLNSPATASNTRTFSVSAQAGSEMLVVSTHNEGGGAPTSVFYGSQEMTFIADTNTGNSRSRGIYYLADPAATGDVIVTYSGTGTFQAGLGYASLSSSNGMAIVLGDADNAISNPVGSTVPSITLNIPEDNSFVYIAVGGNQGTNSDVDVPPADVKLDIPSLNSMSADAGYDNFVAAGTSPTYTFTTTSDRQYAISAASFNVVPEPGSLALLAAGGLMMIKRRRRAYD